MKDVERFVALADCVLLGVFQVRETSLHLDPSGLLAEILLSQLTAQYRSGINRRLLKDRNDLKNHGEVDVLIAVTDGLKMFPEALFALFPVVTASNCTVHRI